MLQHLDYFNEDKSIARGFLYTDFYYVVYLHKCIFESHNYMYFMLIPTSKYYHT